jgi:hypothetical protein
LASPRPIDAGALKSPLQDPHRRDIVRAEGFEEFQAHPPAPPARVLPLEPAGATEDDIGIGGRGRAAGMIPEDQVVSPAIAEGAPEVADGVEGDGELGGDLGQGLAPEMALDDVLPRGGWYGAGHGVVPRLMAGSECYMKRSYHQTAQGWNFKSYRGG